jgi:hypothetical protein
MSAPKEIGHSTKVPKAGVIKPYQMSEPIEVYERTPMFTARNAGHAMTQISEWFERLDAGRHEGPVTRIFEFVDGDHRFTVVIEPVDTPRSDENYDAWRNRIEKP